MKSECNRREFTAASVMALLAGVTVAISGCGSGGGTSYGTNPNPPVSGGSGDKNGSISDNHGHVATITAAQITAAGAIVLNIQGTADHNHTVTLTGDEVRMIGAGTRIAKSSSNVTAHDHTVTFNA